MKFLYKMGAYGCFLGVSIYLPIMNYRGIEVSLETKAILTGILGIYFLLCGRDG